MSVAFRETTRSLSGEQGRKPWLLLVVFLLLGAWFAWVFLGRVVLYVPAHSARLEVAQQPHVLHVPEGGAVARLHVTAGDRVSQGQVLLSLDDRVFTRKLREQETLVTQLETEIAGRQQAVADAEQLHRQTLADLDQQSAQARTRLAESERLAEDARNILNRFEQVLKDGLVAEIDAIKARMEVTRLDAERAERKKELDRIQTARQSAESRRQLARQDEINQIKSQERSLEQARAARDTLRLDREDFELRAPTDGVMGEVAELTPGLWLESGRQIGTLLPPGDVQVVAYFEPGQALGRLQPGQAAVLRFPAFPWLEFGSRTATVARVSGEITGNGLRVSLNPAVEGSEIPLGHGLPCSVEVAVAEVSPWSLLLRKLGKTMDGDHTP